ncbi:hypothetical protein [Deinococcus koreensis]|uniref:Uncharacterized protein n=1 Tax=Deinococcus koreensis TaxID=2054903 RepID=A0A2K3UZM0_9DEIO|nr:hypothetical protein [Deinococcus koreensis]PNY81973.1 hypothetical protein CVO96_11880 [Deinococcus koreensis]
MRQNRGLGCGCLGCGGGTLVVLALLGALAWFVVIKPARDFIAGWQPPQTQTQTPGRPQTPGQPSTGSAQTALTRSEIEKFVRVRRDVRTALGSSFTGLQQVWTDVQGGQTPNILQALNVLRQAGGSIGAARTAQSAALTREGLSPERYAAIRAGVNRALGLPNVDFARAAESLQRGQLPDLSSTVQSASAQESALIAPFRSELTATAAAGLLGL